MVLGEPRDQDEAFDDRGLNYLIEKDLFERIKPVKVDYIETPMGTGFSITSNMSQGPSCGTSCSC